MLLLPSYLCKLVKKMMGHGQPVEIPSDNGTSEKTNLSKLSLAWLIRKILMEN